jgi:hypothetical protein
VKLPRISPESRDIAACIVVAWFTIMLCCAVAAAFARLATMS